MSRHSADRSARPTGFLKAVFALLRECWWPSTGLRYRIAGALLMVLYVVLLTWLWPQASAASGAAAKVALSLSPVAPLAAFIGVFAAKVIVSDELEQRMHLVSFGIATAVVGTASLVGGFLAASRVWKIDGSVLIWVFPALCGVFGVTRMLLKRHYTGTWQLRDR